MNMDSTSSNDDERDLVEGEVNLGKGGNENAVM